MEKYFREVVNKKGIPDTEIVTIKTDNIKDNKKTKTDNKSKKSTKKSTNKKESIVKNKENPKTKKKTKEENKTIKLVSWNLASLRSIIEKKEFKEYLNKSDADIYVLSETKIKEKDIEDLKLEEKFEKLLKKENKKKYNYTWTCSTVKLGYSGLLVMSKEKPINVVSKFDNKVLDGEGRFLCLEFEKFYFVGVYQPTSQKGGTRLDYRTKNWDIVLQNYVKDLMKIKNVIVGGDFNVSHQPIDLHKPDKAHERRPSYFPEERKGFSNFLKLGFIDSFRFKNKTVQKFSWWNQMFKCRESNKGWRLDYFLVDKRMKKEIISADVETEVLGSDHCPVNVEIKIAN